MRCFQAVRTVSFFTLGCKVNFSESDSLACVFEKSGYRIMDFKDKCDVYVINTCAVTGESERKSRQKIRQARNKNSSAVIVVIGCYSERAAGEIYSFGADIVVGNRGKNMIPELVESYVKNNSPAGINGSCIRGECVCGEDDFSCCKKTEAAGEFEEFSETGGALGRIRAVIKVQDGCDSFCSFCIIPHLRGRSRSRSFDSAVEAAEYFVRRGCKELVVTGINLSSYSSQGHDFISLLEGIAKVSGNAAESDGFRIRIGSLSPRFMTRENISRLIAVPGLCSHFHLSLQSACDRTLKRMNRKYSFGEYFNCLQEVRRLAPSAGITTDVIVGFPGETEDDFYESLANIEKCSFSDIHVFPYSRRPLTAADSFTDAVNKDEKARRAELVRKSAEKSRECFVKRNFGRKLTVLFEGDGFGYTENYIKIKGSGRGFSAVCVSEENAVL